MINNILGFFCALTDKAVNNEIKINVIVVKFLEEGFELIMVRFYIVRPKKLNDEIFISLLIRIR
jgi:hypothetical protein